MIFLAIDPIYFWLVGVILLLIAYFSVSFWIYRTIMVDYNKPPVELVDHTEDFYRDSYKWFQETPWSDVTITGYDSTKLHAYYIPSFNKKSNDLAIIVHGYQSKGTDMIIIGQMYSKLGFQVLLLDMRGHGKSEGSFTSFGQYEKYDLKRWINHALRTYGSDLNILIHGVSMGAATAMMCTGLDIPNNVKFLVLDSGFTHVSKTFTNTKRSRGLKLFYLGLDIVVYVKHRFIFEQVRPIKYMRKNTIPFLIIQGDADLAVPLEMAKRLYAVSPANRKELLIIKGSRHALGFRDDFSRCEDAVSRNIKDIFEIKKTYNINTE